MNSGERFGGIWVLAVGSLSILLRAVGDFSPMRGVLGGSKKVPWLVIVSSRESLLDTYVVAGPCWAGHTNSDWVLCQHWVDEMGNGDIGSIASQDKTQSTRSSLIIKGKGRKEVSFVPWLEVWVSPCEFPLRVWKPLRDWSIFISENELNQLMN